MLAGSLVAVVGLEWEDTLYMTIQLLTLATVHLDANVMSSKHQSWLIKFSLAIDHIEVHGSPHRATFVENLSVLQTVLYTTNRTACMLSCLFTGT